MASTTKIVAADVQVTGVLDMRGNPVQNLNTDTLLYPTEPHQGASKAYVDELRDALDLEVQNLTDLVDNGEF